MKKSFKKAIAVLLAVLMVAFSVPFTAFAAPGDYNPDIDVMFGTFHHAEATSWTDYSTGSGKDYSMCGLYDVPVDFNATLTNGGLTKSGTLYIDAAKSAKAAEVVGYEPLAENYTLGVGDYFTCSVVIKNIQTIGAMQAYVQYSDNIEPAGYYSYKSGRKTAYTVGTVSECAAANGTFAFGGTTPITAMSSEGIYGMNVGATGNATFLGSNGSGEHFIGVQESCQNGGDCIDVSTAYDQYYADPNTGELNGYTYSGVAILETFVFKITGEGDIAFSVYDPYNTKEKAYSGAFYIATAADGAMNRQYTTYATNTTDSVDGSENPGSRKMTFFGKNVNNTTEEPACTHTNVTATPAKDATCTEAGNSAYWTCNDCSKMFSDEACTTEITEVPTIPATGHSLEETAAKDATCTEAGNSAYWTCSVCGKMFADANGATEITEVPTISATGHSLSKVEEVPSTCTVKGTAAYWTCTACGKMFSNAEGTTEISAPVELPLADHNYNMVKTEATCTEQSSEVYTCSACGDTYTTHVDPAKGHTAESANNAVAPTCTTAGKEADTVCSVCGVTIAEGAVIPATGHTEVSADNAVAATCTKDGKEADTVCSVCGVTLAEGAVIPATGHNYGDWTSNGDGTHSKVCINAGDDTKTEDCSYSYSVTKAPTIDETGIGTYTCTKCHYSYDIVLDKVTCTHANATKTEEVPATCTEEGTEAYWTCNDCGKLFSDEACTIEIASPVVIAPKGHTEASANNAVAATCTTAGKEADTVCSVCGVTLEEGAVIPATGHTEVSADNGYDATCTEDGKEADTVCSVCGITLTTGAVIPATGHTPGEPVETTIKEPTCTEKGEKNTTVTCAVCGTHLSSVHEELDELGHDFVKGVTVAPTIGEDGYTEYRCSRCGAIEKRDIVPALEGVNITVEATDLGTTAINGEDATNGATVKVLKNSKVALTAAPVEGAEFVGWALNGKIVSESANTTVTALANATYTAVFTETAAAEFTVVFVDNYGNVISTQTVANASEIVAPTAPTRPGYTFKGWSVDYTTLTTGATIYAQFEKDAAATYTVTATGCTITTAAGATATDVMTDVAYDTSVTITANSGTATSWKIGESTVAFGESYTFYVGSDVTVVPQFDSAVTAKPTVTAVNVSEVTETNGLKRAVFLATRSMTDDCTYIGSGYIYGKAADVTVDTTLADVNGSTVKRIDNKTASEQFSVTYGLRSQSGSIAAKAYLAYVDGNGDTQVIYADVQSYTYA